MGKSKPTNTGRRRPRCVSWPRAKASRTRVRSDAGDHVQEAGLPVLDDEEAGAYRARLSAWTSDLRPRDEVELYLVRHAVKLSWRLDRAERAELQLLTGAAARGETDAGPARATAGAGPPLFDDSEAGGRLRYQQLACGTALVGTLNALARLRQLGESGATAPPPAARQAASSPAPARFAGSAPEAVVPPSGQGQPHPVPEEVAGREDSPGRQRSTFLDRVAKRRRRQPDWPGAGGAGTDSGSKAPTASDVRSDPSRRASRPSEPAPNCSEPRRSVGGYPVPMDSSVSANGADRVPIRLRRQSSAVQNLP